MHHGVLATALALSLSSLGMLSTAPAAHAQQASANVRPYTIAAGSLRDALDALASQSGMAIVYPPELVAGKTSRGLSAQVSASNALKRLLDGTGLTWTFVNGDTAVIKQMPQPKATPSRIPPSASPGTSRKEDIVGLPAIMVQGTRTLNMDITRTADDPQPYVVFDRETIQRSGAQNLEGFLRDRLPMNANGMANGLRVTQLGTNSRFNLRGLGAGQTLILIDGRRLPPGPSSGSTPLQPDLNGIPMSAVERIEVLPATASGIYGGSATGGVINIILRQDYAGTEAKVTYGNSFESDVSDRRVDLSTGFNLGDKTNVLLSASWSEQNALNLRERPELVERYYDIVRANAPQLLLPPNNPPLGSTPNIRSANGSNLVLRDGTLLNAPITYIPDGYAGTAADGGDALVANAGKYNLGLANSTQQITGASAQLGQAPRNTALRTTLRHEFSTRVQAFLEANTSETRTIGIAPSTIGAFVRPYRVSASAPNNPFTSDILVTVPTDSFANDSLETTITQHRATGGLIVALPAEWKAAVDYTWGRTLVRQGGSQLYSTGADTAAVLRGELDVLRDTDAYPIDLAPYLTISHIDGRHRITFQNMALRVAGPVMDLPAGPVAISTLLEYRDEKFADSLQHSTGGLKLFLPGRSASAASLYVETKVPLFSEKNRRPFAEALDLQFAARLDQYRTRGKTGFVGVGSNQPIVSATNETRSVNPTVAIRYQPIRDLVLRTSYATGFVAPDVSQLAPSVYPAPLTIVDPRRGNSTTALPLGQVVYLGNPDLEPEKSKNWTLGFILTPRFAPGLRLSLDYMRIRKTDNITNYPTGTQGLIDDEALFPDRVQRGGNLPGDPAGWPGPITALDLTLFNIASAEVEAFDLQLEYSRDTDLGTFGLSAAATRQTHFRTKGLPNQPTIENVGKGFNNPLELTGNAELRWQHRGWTASWLARYYHSYWTAVPTVAGNADAIALQGRGGRIPSQIYHDLYVGWTPDMSGRRTPDFLAGVEFQLGIRNVFDKMPPFDANVYNIYRTLHSPLGDPLGTTYQLAITKRF